MMATFTRSAVTIATCGVQLGATLDVPRTARGLVLFGLCTGNQRHEENHRRVTDTLEARELATLRVELLTPAEERVDAIDACIRFDVETLAARLIGATEWVRASRSIARLPLGYLGAGTAAAAALIAAAHRPGMPGAIVGCAGRPDLAEPVLAAVRAPTLLIVGGADRALFDLNRRALAHLGAHHQLVVVPDATSAFDEPGALDELARVSADWFTTFLTGTPLAWRRSLGDAIC